MVQWLGLRTFTAKDLGRMGRIPGQEGNIPQVTLGAANPHPSPQIPMSKFKDLIWLYKAVCELVSIEGLYKMDSFFLRERSRAREFLNKG